jgi:hypothetical protein
MSLNMYIFTFAVYKVNIENVAQYYLLAETLILNGC